MNAAITEEAHEPGGESPRREVLRTLELRQRLTTAQAAARSQMVRRLRIALPVVAVGLVILFLFNTSSQTVDDAFLKDFANLEATTEEIGRAHV